MSENLSSGSSGSENLVTPPPRSPRPSPAPAPAPVSATPAPQKPGGPITSDDMKLKKDVSVSKPLTFKKND